MPHLAAAPGVSFGMVGDLPVFLDARRDRYAMLPADLGSAFRAMLTSGAPSPWPDEPLTRRLIATGLFTDSNTPQPITPTSHQPAMAGVAVRTAPPLRIADLASIWIACALAARSARRRSFHILLTPPRVSPNARKHGKDDVGLEHDACRFLEARRFVPMTPACLADSLAMRSWLARRGHSCTLVIGVRLEPFEAHCWLEAAGVALNDAPERIASFVPVGLFR